MCCSGSSGFFSPCDLSLIIASWNVNAKEEQPHLLKNWLNPSDVKRADMVVIALQEIIELSPTNTMMGSSYAFSSDLSSNVSYGACERWLQMIVNHLNQHVSEGEKFTLLQSLSMVGIAIFMFTTQQVKSRLSAVQARSISRGGGGILGNKGAVCIRLNIDDTSFCFCCAHLCAHREDVLKRNEDFRVIYNTPVFACENYMTLAKVKSDSCMSPRNSSVDDSLNKLKMKMKNKEGTKLTLEGDVHLKRVRVSNNFATQVHILIFSSCFRIMMWSLSLVTSITE